MPFLQSLLGPPRHVDPGPSALTLRYATPDDASALDRLSVLDCARAPRGLVLLAEVDGTPWAALSLDDHHAVADPFRLTGELVRLLHERARRLRRAGPEALGELPRVWPARG